VPLGGTGVGVGMRVGTLVGVGPVEVRLGVELATGVEFVAVPGP